MPKLYKTIIADPPWKYRNEFRDCGNCGQAVAHYPVMSTDAIAALNVSKIADANSVLLLWITFPMLPDGIKVLSSWGFNYVTAFPWIKIKDVSKDLWGSLQIRIRWGIGFWVRGVSELLMIGKKGTPAPPKVDFVGLLSPSIVHSKKPKSLYEYAETLSGPYLELFARKKRDGWDAWGNEIVGDEVSKLTALLHNQSMNIDNLQGT